ncbi:TPA: holin, partial [Enterococcus faecalis]|nr:holin [Enterococcus faecalis]
MKDELIQDVVERLVRIETKLDNYEVLREKTEDAKEKADYAFSIAKNNEEDIKEIKENQKWSWR